MAQTGATQDSGGSGFFGNLNNGDAPGIPQRPKYDQGSRRAPITESSTTLLRQDVAPMDPVHFDKKTGYPIRQMETGYETLPLPRDGAPVGAQRPASAIAPVPVQPMPMDPADIKTGTGAAPSAEYAARIHRIWNWILGESSLALWQEILLRARFSGFLRNSQRWENAILW